MPSFQDTVLVIGDGPTGLSAALFLTKSGVGCHVLGEGATPVNKAILHNYLGVDGMLGPNFMEHARLQAEGSGAHLHRQKVTRVERTANGFAADTAEGNRFEAQYLVLANGRDPTFARSLAASTKDDVVTIDLNGRTDVDRLYAGGWVARGHKVQVAISVGDGAAIALDILSAIKGKPFHDFDVLPASTADTA
ncbi:MAG: thioredoxin reductase, partial [Thermoplasmata archaeon]|nr:thioredoxin reductase [Thermoplasmata archaeon]